ncbi:MAG: YceI family protein [Gammaproteobacteria bacterium]|nr:YceI family protein [Gammaproteobacteria bacterium]
MKWSSSARRDEIRAAALAVGLVMLALVGCAPLRPLTGLPEGAPPDFPAAAYRRAAAAGGAVYRVDPERSRVVVHVHRAGRLAKLGHDHVVASHAVQGLAARGAGGEGRADLYFALASLRVDEPELRAAAGLEKELSDSDVEATRRNMLQKVLEAEGHPYVRLRVTAVDEQAAHAIVSARLSVHGVTREFEIPAEIIASDGALRARGAFRVRQTDFGMTPYSALGGALRVADELDVRFDVRATRWRFAAAPSPAEEIDGM